MTDLSVRICDVVKPWAAQLPDHPAVVDGDIVWTYSQLESIVLKTRSWLSSLGVRPGDRVMIVGENSRAFVALLLGVASLEAWPVLVSTRLSAQEQRSIQEHCGARRVIFAPGVAGSVLELAERQGALIEEAFELGALGVGPLNENVFPESSELSSADKVAAVIYTSGTTGTPKGVMLTHGNVLFIAAASARIRALTRHDRMFGVLPMTHAVGLSVVLLGSLLSGATVYLEPRFDPMAARIAIEKNKLTVVLGVPSMFSQFLQYAKLRGLKSLQFPDLRIISSSGAPLDFATKSATEQLFGMPLHNGYGITECSPTIAQTRIQEPRTDTSVGSLLPGVDAKFIGPDGREVAPGEVGELRVRGPNVMKGYYRDVEGTSDAVDSDGWFNTRDLAKLEAGNLFVIGRTKELIIRSGFNVYPAEVEAMLKTHPAVALAAVIGRWERGDEEVVAFVQPLPGAVLEVTDLEVFAANRLAAYKRPSRFVIMSALPMTATGKVARKELEQLFVDEKQSSAVQ
jgi:acyl-CoA synthetase (AMP-forming)/AMP-acid ligase II